jgi:hypothetical protein
MLPSPRSILTSAAALLAGGLLLPGCLFTIGSPRHTPSSSGASSISPSASTDGTAQPASADVVAQDADKKQEGEKKKEDPAKKAAERERKLVYARIEQKIAELSATNDQREADAGLARARRNLDEAKGDLDHFKSVEMPISLDDKKIDLDRVTFRADESKEELAELESMYKKEEYAELTKELVIKRGRRQLELAQRDLKVEERKYDALQKQELQKKQRGLEDGVRKAEEELASAETKVEKQRLENEVSLLKAKNKIEDLEKGEDSGGDAP